MLDPIAVAPPPVPRRVSLDDGPLFLKQKVELSVNVALEAGPFQRGLPSGFVERTELGDRAVCQHRPQPPTIMKEVAGRHGMRAGSVFRDHSPRRPAVEITRC